MSKKIILDLCGGSGSWSLPYSKSRPYNYDVRVITLPDYDVRYYIPPKKVHGILAAPPCDHFTVSGAQYWKNKDEDGRTGDALEILDACLNIIDKTECQFWALENPVGRIPKLRPQVGKPRLIFNPCDYGDPYTKRTCLWGKFNIPIKNPVEPKFVIAANGDRYSPIHWSTGGKSDKTKMLRSITPPGFAKAFFEANP
jgi:hypothetical protein